MPHRFRRACLNQDLCNIEKWATSWNVLFGAAKCKTVTISNRQDAKDSHPCLQFFGTTLTETETVELLGLTLIWARTSPGSTMLPAWLNQQLSALVFFVELPHICFPLKEQWSTRPSSDQRWNMPALHGLVLLLPHCHSWMLSKGVLSGSLTFLRMTSSLTKFSHWEPEEKLEPSTTLFHRMYYGEAPELLVSCFLNIFSWIPVLDALLDRMT